jgi:hypothetical protein
MGGLESQSLVKWLIYMLGLSTSGREGSIQPQTGAARIEPHKCLAARHQMGASEGGSSGQREALMKLEVCDRVRGLVSCAAGRRGNQHGRAADLRDILVLGFEPLPHQLKDRL